MSKNAKAFEARRQKRLAKRRAPKPKKTTPPKKKIPVPLLQNTDYVFWLCHGANFIASTPPEWTPVFPDIYRGILPDPAVLAGKLVFRTKLNSDSDQGLSEQEMALLAWSMTDRTHMSVFKMEAERRLQAADPACAAERLACNPGNPVVWGMMDEVRRGALTIQVR